MLLWTRELGARVVRAEVADLDGDGRNEVVAAAGGEIVVYEGGGTKLWSGETNAPRNYDGAPSGEMTVHTFATGKVFRKPTRQVVALSVDGRGFASRLTLFGSDGRLLSAYWHPGRLQQVVIAARTAHHAPKIIVSAVNHDLQPMLHVDRPVGGIFMLDPKRIAGEAPPYRGKLGSGTQLWYGALTSAQSISSLEIVDHDNDGRRDIAASTSHGQTVYLDFDGKIMATKGRVQFGLIAGK